MKPAKGIGLDHGNDVVGELIKGRLFWLVHAYSMADFSALSIA